MSLLDTISKPKRNALIITVMGDPGIGKTTLASTFPEAIMIRTEDGTNAVVDSDISCFPIVDSYKDVISQLRTLLEEEHGFKTLIIDSISALDTMAVETAIDVDYNEQISSGARKPKRRVVNNIFGGFGSGGEYISKLHGRIRKCCERLRLEKNMNIVFIGHSVVKEMDLPDSTKYSYFDLRVTKQARSHYIDNVDAVCYMKLQSFVKVSDSERNKVVSKQQRVLLCHSNLSYVTKNRFGISEEIEINKGDNPFLKYMQQNKTCEVK